MREEMKSQEPGKRINNFDEVTSGFTEEQAVKEAERCLQCKDKPCTKGCPAGIDVSAFVKLIREKHFEKALEKIKESNHLPAVCGRVCHQEDKCELNCTLGKKGAPIAIGYLERFLGDNYAAAHPKLKKNNKTAAMIGSGPGSLACAFSLAMKGYTVTVFEALHKFGGVLRYGIPQFRLPKEVLNKEIEHIKSLGVKFRKNIVIGKTFSIEEVAEKFDAVFIGTGAGLPKFLEIPGENLNGVYTANEFLTRINLMKAYKFPEYNTPIQKGKDVVVIGGGDTAIDAARTARRLGSDVTIMYRRGFDEMPARREEVEHAQKEGIKFLMMTMAVRILGGKDVEGITCVQVMMRGEDETGRRMPFPIEDSEFRLPCDQIIIAVGQNPNPVWKNTNIKTSGKGIISVDETLRTSIKDIYAGGDAIGRSSVIDAIEDGIKAAESIGKDLADDKK